MARSLPSSCPSRIRGLAAGALAVFVLAAVSAATARDEPSSSPPALKGARIFATGHSFHMPMLDPLNQIAESAGFPAPVIAGRQGIGGSSVTKHWDLPDAKDKARKSIKTGAVDVLTVAPFHTPLPDPAISKFTALLLEHNPAGRVTVQASWVPMDGVPGLTNAKRDEADPAALSARWAPFTNKMRDQVRDLNREFPRPGRPVVLLVPVGDAVIRLRERVDKGEVPGIARQSDLFRDNLGHGKTPISVLTAYCHFAVIFGRNPAGLPVPPALARDASLADHAEQVNRVLQDVAWQAVTAEPLSGVSAGK